MFIVLDFVFGVACSHHVTRSLGVTAAAFITPWPGRLLYLDIFFEYSPRNVTQGFIFDFVSCGRRLESESLSRAGNSHALCVPLEAIEVLVVFVMPNAPMVGMDGRRYRGQLGRGVDRRRESGMYGRGLFFYISSIINEVDER